MTEEQRINNVYLALVRNNLPIGVADFLANLDARVRNLEKLVCLKRSISGSKMTIDETIQEIYEVYGKNSPEQKIEIK